MNLYERFIDFTKENEILNLKWHHFFLNGNLACMKSYCATGGYIRAAIMMMEKSMERAQEAFSEFDPA